MTPEQLWRAFQEACHIPQEEYEAWSFGCDADGLAELVRRGEKTATSSLFLLYELEQEPLPQAGGYDVILDSKGQAVCVIQTTKVYVVPFRQVSEEHARREGEGDKSLAYWREVHQKFFAEELKAEGLEFTEDMSVVCEEFQLVYKL